MPTQQEFNRYVLDIISKANCKITDGKVILNSSENKLLLTFDKRKAQKVWINRRFSAELMLHFGIKTFDEIKPLLRNLFYGLFEI